MVILGIDPGLERVGWGCVQREGSRLQALGYGLIQTPKIELAQRLKLIYDEVCGLFETYQPTAIALERQIFAANKTTAFDVSKAVGVILLASVDHHLTPSEYTPPEIKQAVVGVGNADKKQVQFMVTKLLSLAVTPKPDDVADALAIAICHAMRSRISVPQ